MSVQSVQTGILMATGDIISQLNIDDRTIKTLDFSRTLRFGGLGLFVIVSIPI